jgi:ADP-heptose:LPS heptosyltransferase
LIGGVDVVSSAKAVVKEIRDPRLVNYVGQISLGRSVALIEKSSVFVGPDSGLMHLAYAVKTPVVAVFGPGQLSKWAPPPDKNTVLSLHLPCSPCTQFGYTNPTCNGVYACIRQIPIDQVSEVALAKLKKAGGLS